MGKVANHYDRNALGEWHRLDRHRTEFAVTLRVLADYLPATPSTILDIGGGPGRYAIELARQGYDVTLLDISAECLQLAEYKAAEAGVSFAAFIQGDALDLGATESESVDAVLLMGPLYHLLERRQRAHTVREAVRVLKPGGRLFAAFINRYAPFRHAAGQDPAWYLENKAYALQILETGIHDRGEGFPNAYFAHPAEIAPFMEESGLRTLLLVGCEGVASGIEEKLNELEGQAWRDWVELNYRLGREPLLHGAAEHLLYVGELPG